jgi:DNA-binding CsgD family transcriptional regulator
MNALARGDERRILRFVAEGEDFCGDHAFEGEFLAQLGGLVRADWIGFLYGDGPPYADFVRAGDNHFFENVVWTEVERGACARLPTFRYLERNFGAVKISDFIPARELRRTQLYDVLLEPVGLEHSLAVRLPVAEMAQFVFDRQKGDFGERDRQVLVSLTPHLVRLGAAANTRRRLRSALALHEVKGTAVVLFEPGGRITYASSAAQELLQRYFGKTGATLPAAVASWLHGAAEPLRVAAGDRTLMVEHIDDGLLLEERRPLPHLTAREREILELVAGGKSNGEIAEHLWIAPGTVRKHLDNVYAKLDVHTRTAAAAVLRD